MTKKPTGGEYDYGKRDAAKTASFKIKSYDFKSQSDMKIRATSGYADNAMEDPSALNEGDNDMMDRLHAILHKAGASQSEIQNGITLSNRGYEKVAAQLGIDTQQVKTLLNSLRGTHKDGLTQVEEDSSNRFGYEADVLGHVSINDSTTGQSKMFTGSEGAMLLGRLEMVEVGSEAEQAILADHMGITESVEEMSGGEDFRAEIANQSGTFNFPWKLMDMQGTGTAAYRGVDGRLDIRVISVRDAEGEETQADAKAIAQQARDFIGKE